MFFLLLCSCAHKENIWYWYLCGVTIVVLNQIINIMYYILSKKESKRLQKLIHVVITKSWCHFDIVIGSIYFQNIASNKKRPGFSAWVDKKAKQVMTKSNWKLIQNLGLQLIGHIEEYSAAHYFSFSRNTQSKILMLPLTE